MKLNDLLNLVESLVVKKSADSFETGIFLPELRELFLRVKFA